MNEDLFITVPETTLPNGIVVPSFQVGQYVCSAKPDNQGLAITQEGTPWVRISYHDARKACEVAGYKLITEQQWLAIAHNAAQQPCNWTKGEVGKGKLFRGIRNGHVSSGQPGTYEPADAKERRWLTLSNGERICDMAGNVFQWVFDDAQGDENGITAKPFAEDSPSITAPYPNMEKGMGWRPDAGTNWSGLALIRGGYWNSERHAGAFRLDNDFPGGEWVGVGFRCTK